MEKINEILNKYRVVAFVFDDAGKIYIDFDEGVRVPFECINEIKSNFLNKDIYFAGFFGDSGFRVAIDSDRVDLT